MAIGPYQHQEKAEDVIVGTIDASDNKVIFWHRAVPSMNPR